MRNHLLKITIALVSLCCLTSCFDIQENLFLKKDGSGNFSFVVDLQQLKSMMAMFEDTKTQTKEKGGQPQKESANEKLNSAFDDAKEKLLQVQGIKNVKAIEDTANFKFGVSFSFADINSLNKAMNKLFQDDSVKPGTKDVVYFEKVGDKLIRYESLDSKSILGKSGSLSSSMGKKLDNSFFSMDEVFATVSYTTSYEFENKIQRSGNENSSLSSDMKKVTIKCYPFAPVKDSTQKKCTVGNTITFK